MRHTTDRTFQDFFLLRKEFLNVRTSLGTTYLQLAHQCDQMAKSFVQYLAIFNNVNLPNSAKVGSTFCQILNKPLINCPIRLIFLINRRNFAKSGHTDAHLVLHTHPRQQKQQFPAHNWAPWELKPNSN